MKNVPGLVAFAIAALDWATRRFFIPPTIDNMSAVDCNIHAT